MLKLVILSFLIFPISNSYGWFVPPHYHNHEDFKVPNSEPFMEVCRQEKEFIARANKRDCKERQEYREVFCYEPEVEKHLDDESLEHYNQFCELEEFCHFNYIDEILDVPFVCSKEAEENDVKELIPFH